MCLSLKDSDWIMNEIISDLDDISDGDISFGDSMKFSDHLSVTE